MIVYNAPTVRSFFLIFCAILVGRAQSKQAVDVMIVDKPHTFKILNKYEQPLTPDEEQRLTSYSPFEIVEQQALLGDQITPAMKVRLEGETFYLQKKSDGALIGDNRPGYRQIFKNCRVIDDTMHVVRDNAVLLAEQYPSSGKRTYAQQGQLVQRLFVYRNRYYVKTLGPKPVFGWTSPAANAWKPLESRMQPKSDTIPADVQQQIAQRLESANRTYQQFFAHFNKLTGKQKSVPTWKKVEQSKHLVYRLNASRTTLDNLQQSTAQLLEELELALLGKNVSVNYENGRIAFKPDD